jgi:molybdenum cofactor cytidylyltransferase
LQFSSLSILIPAAGASTRLGRAKQLVDYKGSPLLQHSLNTAMAVSPLETIIVTGANAKIIKNSVGDSDAHWVHNPNWSEGLGSSIATGVTAISPKASGVLILLCDQWRIEPADLKKLAEVWSSDPRRIVTASSAVQTMPPVIFPSSLFKQLKILSGHQGAKYLINAQAELVTAVPIDNAVFDLDTQAQLDDLKNHP